MEGEFKQCPNGHYYQGDYCPYCKSGSNNAGSNTALKTEMFVGSDSQAPTDVISGSSGAKTTVIDGQGTLVTPMGGKSNAAPANRTVFGDEAEVEQGTGRVEKTAPRYERKLVGWLVTYSLDPMGTDFKLYEGRNIIGRDMDCNITVNDGKVSGKHAILLFRAEKYSLTDTQSAHGTFVNNEDIELDPRYLKDGDTIRTGDTTFLFRTSLI